MHSLSFFIIVSASASAPIRYKLALLSYVKSREEIGANCSCLTEDIDARPVSCYQNHMVCIVKSDSIAKKKTWLCVRTYHTVLKPQCCWIAALPVIWQNLCNLKQTMKVPCCVFTYAGMEQFLKMMGISGDEGEDAQQKMAVRAAQVRPDGFQGSTGETRWLPGQHRWERPRPSIFLAIRLKGQGGKWSNVFFSAAPTKMKDEVLHHRNKVEVCWKLTAIAVIHHATRPAHSQHLYCCRWKPAWRSRCCPPPKVPKRSSKGALGQWAAVRDLFSTPGGLLAQALAAIQLALPWFWWRTTSRLVCAGRVWSSKERWLEISSRAAKKIIWRTRNI